MTKTVRATPAAAGHGPRMSDQLGGSIGSEYTHTPGRNQELRFHGDYTCSPDSTAGTATAKAAAKKSAKKTMPKKKSRR